MGKMTFVLREKPANEVYKIINFLLFVHCLTG